MEGDVERVVVFRGGRPINVISRMQEETLGRMLLDDGKITSEQYSALLHEMVQTKKRAGEILVAMGILGPQDIYSALAFQSRRKLLNCFKMVDFGFSLTEKKIAPEMAISNPTVSEVILGGIGETYSVDRLLTEFPVDEESEFTLRRDDSLSAPRLGPRAARMIRSIEPGTALAKLMSIENDLHMLLTVLYSLHALYLVDVSGLARPSTKDLDLEALAEETVPSAAAAPAPAPPPPVMQEEEEEEDFRPPTLAAAMKTGRMNPALARKALTLDRDDHFSLLEINRQAEQAAIKTAYEKILEDYRLKNIDSAYSSELEREAAGRLLDKATIAYRVLSDDKSRQEYLATLKRDGAATPGEVSPRILADVEAQKGELALHAKRYQDAMELFDAAIGIYPNEPSYHFKFGLAGYFKAVDETAADQQLDDLVRKPFLKAIAIDPSYDQARLYLGYISKRNGEYKRALKEFQSALDCNPHNRRAQSEVRLLNRRMEMQKR